VVEKEPVLNIIEAEAERNLNILL